jgi:chaperone modulatory protein CbpM
MMTIYSAIGSDSEVILLNEEATCSTSSLIEISGLSQQELNGLIDIGIVTPIYDLAPEPYFHLHYIVATKRARRLIDDFELDMNGMLLAMTLMQKITQLELELISSRIDLTKPTIA